MLIVIGLDRGLVGISDRLGHDRNRRHPDAAGLSPIAVQGIDQHRRRVQIGTDTAEQLLLRNFAADFIFVPHRGVAVGGEHRLVGVRVELAGAVLEGRGLVELLGNQGVIDGDAQRGNLLVHQRAAHQHVQRTVEQTESAGLLAVDRLLKTAFNQLDLAAELLVQLRRGDGGVTDGGNSVRTAAAENVANAPYGKAGGQNEKEHTHDPRAGGGAELIKHALIQNLLKGRPCRQLRSGSPFSLGLATWSRSFDLCRFPPGSSDGKTPGGIIGTRHVS